MKLTARKSVTGFLLVLPMMLGFLALYAVPFAMVVANSATQGIASNLRWVGLENIRRLLHNGLFRLAFANTAKFLLVGIPLLLVVAYSIALVVKKYAFQFRAIRSVLLMPYIMPLVGAVVLVPSFPRRAGWQNWPRPLGFRRRIGSTPIWHSGWWCCCFCGKARATA